MPTMLGDPYSAVCAPASECRDSPLRIAVADEHPVAALLEPAPQLLDQHDRPMATAGATERDRQVALPLAPIAREREVEQLDDVAEELLGVLPPEHELGD